MDGWVGQLKARSISGMVNDAEDKLFHKILYDASHVLLNEYVIYSMQPYIILYKTTLQLGVRNLPKVFTRQMENR